MLNKIRDTLFFKASNTLSAKRRSQYKTVLWLICVIHAIGLIIAFGVSFLYYSANGQSIWLNASAILQYVSFLSGLLLFILSLKSEVLVSQTYDLAHATSQSSTHGFESFRNQIEWLIENLPPDKFDATYPSLCITVSTPIYGIADSIESAELYLSYLESWVDRYEKINHATNDRPTIELCFWNKAANLTTFQRNYSEWERSQNNSLVDKLSNLLKRLKKLKNKRFIDLFMYYTDKTDTRIFLVNSRADHQYGGIVVVFSPLTESSVKHKGWQLTGFSFWEKKSYENVYAFNVRLMHMDHEKNPIDMVGDLDDPKAWLLNHYGFDQHT